MESLTTNYKVIFSDILEKRHPNKKELCEALLDKKHFSAMDVVELDQIIFDKNKSTEASNHRLRSYSKSDIIKILEYQKKNRLNNSQLANHFKISRNTIAK